MLILLSWQLKPHISCPLIEKKNLSFFFKQLNGGEGLDDSPADIGVPARARVLNRKLKNNCIRFGVESCTRLVKIKYSLKM